MHVDQLFEGFKTKRIAVLGDVMVDAYIRGSVHRISPEAPVPIVNLAKTEDRLGGAANVALNLVALGAQVVVCTVIGEDDYGKKLINLLQQQGISTEGVWKSNTRKTTVKTRIIGNNQQLIRIDSEQTDLISSEEEDRVLAKIRSLLASGIDALIFEDYNKGLLTPRLIREVVCLCREHGVVTTVDPKKDHFLAYEGVTLFKPNLKELREGLQRELSFSDFPAFQSAVVALHQKLKNDISFVTLSEHGVYISSEHERHHIPAHLRNIADVSGAGDTVISVATLCLVAGLSLRSIAEIANLAGGLVCEESGVVSIQSALLREEVKRACGEMIE